MSLRIIFLGGITVLQLFFDKYRKCFKKGCIVTTFSAKFFIFAELTDRFKSV